jgi:phosphinothricin acetyltransferase
MSPPMIRPATADDLPAITEIYNHAILHTTATFDTEPKTDAEQLAWFKAHDERHPILVATMDGKVVGWASLSAWSDRCAYHDTAEVSAYVDAGFRGQGMGRQLMKAIDDAAARLGFHTLIARISEGNVASVRLCEALGYVQTGVMKEVGLKFGRRLDVHILQRFFGDPPAA